MITIPTTRRMALATTLALALVGTARHRFGQSAPAGTTLRGAGSTFEAPIIKKWIEEYPATRGSDLDHI